MRKHPKYKETCNKSFSNKMSGLFQGVVKGENGIGKRAEGTNIVFVVRFEVIQKDRLNEICYTSVVCEVRYRKKDPKHTRITICGTNFCYPGNVGTNIASLELFNLMINSVLSQTGAKKCVLTQKTFTLAHHLLDQSMLEINCPRLPKSSPMNTT